MKKLVHRALSAPLRLGRRRSGAGTPRILVIRRNRMGDMICTVPLLRALRRAFPDAHLAVACDAPGHPIARACPAVDEVILLRRGWNRWLDVYRNAWTLQGYDWVLAAKAGFDHRLALLARCTNAPRRVGYEDAVCSAFYTDPLPIPANLWEIHQIEATLRLLGPMGVTSPPDPVGDLVLELPASARAFADAALADGPFGEGRRLAVVNVSSTAPLRFGDEDFAALVAGWPEDVAVAVVGLPVDQERARRVADAAPGRARAVATPGALELAALLGRAAFFLTGEGGAAHLAAAMGTPTVVLWSEGPFEKWHSRGPGQSFVRLGPGEEVFSRARVREALEPYF